MRLHRAGEGEPYTGLKAKGTELGPVIPLADAAVLSGSTQALDKLIADTTREGLERRLEHVVAKRRFEPQDLERGREYVESYVSFIHYVERVYDAAWGARAKQTIH